MLLPGYLNTRIECNARNILHSMQKISVNMEKISTARRQERQQKNTHKTYSIVMQTLKSFRKHTNDGAYTSDTFACALFHRAPNGIHVVHVKILSTGRMTAAIDCKNRKKRRRRRKMVCNCFDTLHVTLQRLLLKDIQTNGNKRQIYIFSCYANIRCCCCCSILNMQSLIICNNEKTK